MICVRCNKAEATYDAPGKWCDDCWNDWWFNVEYLTRDMSGTKKREGILTLAVERAQWELKDKYGDKKAPDDEIAQQAKMLAAPIEFTDEEIKNEIIRQNG